MYASSIWNVHSSYFQLLTRMWQQVPSFTSTSGSHAIVYPHYQMFLATLLHFCVCSTTGTNTQHVESYWNRAELKLKRRRGCHANQIPSYLERDGQTKRQDSSEC